MKRFQITAAEYEAIKAKEAETKDKNVSRRLRVLMLRYEGKSLDEISKITNLHRVSISQICEPIYDVLLREGIKHCYYAHLHGQAVNFAFTSEKDGIKFELLSADYLKFCPKLIKLTK